MKTYDAKDIKVLEGLDAVRLRPGMYIGSTTTKGLHHLLWEIVDNSIDEITNGFGDKIIVTLNNDGSVSVEDNGRGIPVDLHPTLKISGVEVVFTKLHAGGKFDNESYVTSGGLHGVGAAVTNALSKWVKVEIYKNNTTYTIEFGQKIKDNKLKSGVVLKPLKDIKSTTNHTGTKVTFLPDEKIFENTSFYFEVISRRLKELAFLNKGVTIIFEDNTNKDSIRREYKFDGGLIDFIKYLDESKTPLFDDPIFISGNEKNMFLELAMQYTDAYAENIFSYVNNIPTIEGGTHESGFKVALTKAMNELAKKNGLLKEKEILIGEDYRSGLTVVLSFKMQNVQFEGQTKTKLGNSDARNVVEDITYQELINYFNNPDNLNKLNEIIKKAISNAKLRETMRKEKEITKAKNSLDNFNLVGKLSNCSGKKAENNELFIVEGDSAGGTAKQARDRSFQAILPLRGKPLNSEKKRLDQILANEEIRTIISAIGASIGDSFNVENLNYHKIIILSDADQDGAHIRAILLTFFFRYMKELINGGHLFIGMPPLYKVTKKDKTIYCYDDKQLNEVRENLGGLNSIQRYKGLGEMNANQLWETTMDPKNRSLIQVTIEDAANAEKLVTTLMGDSIELRKKYIIENADFNKIDNYEKELNKQLKGPTTNEFEENFSKPQL